MNLDEYSDIGTHWIALYTKNNDVTHFDSFGVEHIPKEIKTFIGNKNIKTNTGIQAYRHMIQQCVNIFALDFLSLCLQERL